MKRKMMIIMMLLALVPTFLIGIITNNYMLKSLEVFQENALSDTAGVITLTVSRFYNEQYMAVQSAAAQEPYIKILESAATKDNTAVMQWEAQAKKLIADSCLLIGEASLIDLDGKIIMAYDSREVGIMLNKTELYKTILSGAEYYKGPVIFGDGSQRIDLAVPVKNQQGKLVGILKQRIHLDYMREYIQNAKIGKTGYVFVLSKNGTLIYNGKKDQGLSTIYSEFESMSDLDQLINDFSADQLKDTSGIIKYRSNGVQTIGAYEKAENTDWLVVTAMEQKEVYAEVEKLRDIIFDVCVLIGFLGAIVGYLMSRVMIHPLTALNLHLKRIAAGDLTTRCNVEGKDEFKELFENVNHLADNLQRSEKELRMSARIDSLARIPNRYAIYEVLDTLLYKHKNQAILMLDIDGLKQINDNLGHDMGDRVLAEVGEVLRSLPQHICYPSRIGGDKFLVFVTDWDEKRYPEKIAERLIKDIKGIRFIDDVRVHISVSIGVEYLSEDRMDKKKLIKRSDNAMYKAKDMGKNTYVVYSQFNKKEA